ncbi:unnamed protein product [Ilex paraguariensis]|uniref:DUF7032 domain-containing protein n=1 Tax=Ilex paraguariensis TaxID=185542 RepID=A0ABC8TJQ3_9AQUA
MHPATVSPPPPNPPPPPTTTQTLDEITTLLCHLLPYSLSVKSFSTRWQIIRSKLATLKSSISEISDSPHWSENPLLQTLLPNLLSTLHRVQTLCDQCSDPSFNPGKLLMQSDLDMATGWLSKQIQDLDLLLRSGVLRQSNAIVLSQPGPGSAKEDLGFYIKDLFTRLQIGGIEFKKKAMESLLQLLSDDEKSASLVAREGNVGYLVHLLDLNTHPSLVEHAVSAVSILVSANDLSRKCVFEEGGLGPLLRIIESGSMGLKEKAAMAVEAITADSDNAWAISAYGGVSILIEVCKSGSIAAQSHAVGAIRNVSTVEDIRVSLAEEGAIPVLVQLLNSGTALTQEKSANCIAILASSGENFRELILLQDKGLQRLLQLLHESSNSDTVEHVLRAIYSLSASESASRVYSSSTSFIIQLAEIIKQGNIVLQHISASLLANLSMRGGCECIGFAVAVRSNRKDLVRDEKSLMRLVQMLDPRNELVSKKFPLAVVSAVMGGGSQGCRKKLVAAGAYGYLQRLTEREVAGAKKALQRLSGNRLKSIFSRTWRE